MGAHVEIIKLIIAYALTGSFLFTLIVTCLSLINVVKSIDKQMRKKLFTVLIVNVAVIGVGVFSDMLNLNPVNTTEAVQSDERLKIADSLIQGIIPAGNASNMRIFNPRHRAEISTTLSIVKKLSPEEANPEVDSVLNFIRIAPANLATRADSANFADSVRNRLIRINTSFQTRAFNQP